MTGTAFNEFVALAVVAAPAAAFADEAPPDTAVAGGVVGGYETDGNPAYFGPLDVTDEDDDLDDCLADVAAASGGRIARRRARPLHHGHRPSPSDGSPLDTDSWEYYGLDTIMGPACQQVPAR